MQIIFQTQLKLKKLQKIHYLVIYFQFEMNLITYNFHILDSYSVAEALQQMVLHYLVFFYYLFMLCIKLEN